MKVNEVYKPFYNRLNNSPVQITGIDEKYKEVTYVFLEPFEGKITTTFESFRERFELDNTYGAA